jgi:hypothetical protein
MTTTHTAVLTSRQTALQELLSKIVQANDAGQTPSKADLTRGLATKTRAAHYSKIDTLITLGLVSRLMAGGTYMLTATTLGRTENELW